MRERRPLPGRAAALLEQGLAVGCALLIAAAEGLLARIGVAGLEFGAALLVGFAAEAGTQGGLEAFAEEGLVLVEVLGAFVVFLLDVADAQPPFFARLVDG